MSRRRDRSWPPAGEALPHPVVDNHTHLETVAALTDAAGWRPREDGAVPDQPVPDEPVPDQPVPDRPVPDRPVPDQPVPDDAAPAGPAVTAQLARAAEVGVTRAVQIGCDLPSIPWTLAAVAAHQQLLGGVAIHPNEAVRHARVEEVGPDGLPPRAEPHHEVPLDEAIARVAQAAADPRVRVIGETGLDFFRAGERGRAVQVEAFRAHIALAKERGLVLQIHDRDAHAEVIDVLLADGAPERTVFHCYSGDAAMARLAAERGWYLSFAGPLTYPANHDLRAALAVTPIDRVLLESDAPYLPPHPFRGRPNGPYLVAEVARAAAAVTGLDLVDLAERVWRTSLDLYGPW